MDYHGHGTANVVDYLCDAQTLPNAGTEDSDQMVYIGGKTNNKLKVYVYANNTVEIESGQAFSIELEGYTSDTAGSATPPFSDTDAHYYLIHKTSADGELVFTKTEFMVPEDILNNESYDYIQLKFTTDADESADKVDAWVEVVR